MKIQPNDSLYPDPMRGSDQSFTNQNPELLPTGFTIRAELAARAMQGLLASIGQHDVMNSEDIAHDAVMYADALIKELNKG